MKMFSDPYYYLGLLVGGLTAYWWLNRDKSTGTTAGTNVATTRFAANTSKLDLPGPGGIVYESSPK